MDYLDRAHRRFSAKVGQPTATGCLLWTGAKFNGDPAGYGQFSFGLGRDRKNWLAHRWAWVQTHGPVPAGMVLDHACRNRSCVNVAHLRVVTPRDNVLNNSDSIQAANTRKTHCAHGHEFTPENTHYFNGGKSRYCRTCKRKQSRDDQRRRRASRMA